MLSAPSLRFLVVGRGAMGLLHAHWMEEAGHEVAFLHRRPSGAGATAGADAPPQGGVDDWRGGVVPLGETSDDARPLLASCVDADGAASFLRSGSGRAGRTGGIFVAVKTHHIVDALTPLVSPAGALGAASAVVLLHNGLADAHTEEFLDRHAPQRIATMVTMAGATLLTEAERKREESGGGILLDAVARHTGPGASFVFPRGNGGMGKTDESREEMTSILRALAGDGSSGGGGSGDGKIPASAAAAFPDCRLLSTAEGRCEQVLKLAVNVSINGLLARRSLREWRPSRSTSDPPHRVVNGEVLASGELPLALNLARLVLGRAIAADPANPYLRAAADRDEAALRTEGTLRRVANNVCSTVADICGGRKTERTALLDAVTREWPGHAGGEQHDDDGEDAEAAEVLGEIDDVLRAWDQHVAETRSEESSAAWKKTSCGKSQRSN